MKLRINRGQQAMKGMLGGSKGVSFTLRYQLELTQEESELISEYRLGSYPVTWHTVQGTRVPAETIASLVRGTSLTLTDVETLLNNERVIIEACDGLPPLLQVVRTFGGDEVIDYPRATAP